jgi:hypothetical protein
MIKSVTITITFCLSVTSVSAQVQPFKPYNVPSAPGPIGPDNPTIQPFIPSPQNYGPWVYNPQTYHPTPIGPEQPSWYRPNCNQLGCYY